MTVGPPDAPIRPTRRARLGIRIGPRQDGQSSDRDGFSSRCAPQLYNDLAVPTPSDETDQSLRESASAGLPYAHFMHERECPARMGPSDRLACISVPILPRPRPTDCQLRRVLFPYVPRRRPRLTGEVTRGIRILGLSSRGAKTSFSPTLAGSPDGLTPHSLAADDVGATPGTPVGGTTRNGLFQVVSSSRQESGDDLTLRGVGCAPGTGEAIWAFLSVHTRTDRTGPGSNG